MGYASPSCCHLGTPPNTHTHTSSAALFAQAQYDFTKRQPPSAEWESNLQFRPPQLLPGTGRHVLVVSSLGSEQGHDTPSTLCLRHVFPTPRQGPGFTRVHEWVSWVVGGWLPCSPARTAQL